MPRRLRSTLAVTTTGLALAAVLLASSVGSAEELQYKLAPVSGRLAFSDGSLIPGAEIYMKFYLIIQEGDDRGVPRPGVARINPADGTFQAVSTYQPNDGAIVGMHKITVVALGADGKPNGAVADVFSNWKTTPLQMEIEATKNNIDFLIPKPAEK